MIGTTISHTNSTSCPKSGTISFLRNSQLLTTTSIVTKQPAIKAHLIGTPHKKTPQFTRGIKEFFASSPLPIIPVILPEIGLSNLSSFFSFGNVISLSNPSLTSFIIILISTIKIVTQNSHSFIAICCPHKQTNIHIFPIEFSQFSRG